MKAALFAFLLLLAGASSATLQGTRDDRLVTMRVIWYADQRELAEACRELGAWPGVPLAVLLAQPYLGCAKIWTDTLIPYCEVHVLRPERLDDRRTLALGHEALHCFIGHYH